MTWNQTRPGAKRPALCFGWLAAKVGEEPEDEREDGAQEQASDNGKVKGSVFAAMDDVTRKFSQAEWELATQEKKPAKEHEQNTQEKKSAAEFA